MLNKNYDQILTQNEKLSSTDKTIPLIRKGVRTDLEKLDDRKRKQIVKNRLSAERSRKKKIEQMTKLSELCEKQQKEIERLSKLCKEQQEENQRLTELLGTNLSDSMLLRD